MPNQTIVKGGVFGTESISLINADFANCMQLNAGLAAGSAQQLNDLFTEYTQDNITANAGGGQSGAYPLIAQTNRITTVATVGDSVKLPASTPGLEILLINHGANAMQVYGAGTDTIDDVASATGVSHMSNSAVIYICTSAGRWYTDGLAMGYAGGGLSTSSYVNGLTAHAGGGQASATALTAMINRVTTVASANDSVVLPATTIPGLVIYVANAAASNSMNVFPVSGDAINALGANAAFAIAANKTATFVCANAGQWHAILSA